MSDVSSVVTFGNLLKHLRLRARLTQDEFGLAVGYSRAHVARLENGQRLPDVGAVRARFAEALHLKDEPQTIARLIELAAVAREDTPREDTPRDEFSGPALTQRAQPIPHNLPAPLTSFIGRTRELRALERLLPTTRL